LNYSYGKCIDIEYIQLSMALLVNALPMWHNREHGKTKPEIAGLSPRVGFLIFFLNLDHSMRLFDWITLFDVEVCM